MDQIKVEDYIALLPYSEVFTELNQDLKNRIIFGSHEMLVRRYDTGIVSDEIVAVQALFVAEGEEEEFAKFKRQGVTSIGLSGLSISVKGSEVSPEVIAILGEPKGSSTSGSTGVFFGRLL